MATGESLYEWAALHASVIATAVQLSDEGGVDFPRPTDAAKVSIGLSAGGEVLLSVYDGAARWIQVHLPPATARAVAKTLTAYADRRDDVPD